MSKIIPFDYGDKLIRVLTDEVSGDPLWIAKDICDVLDLGDTNKAVLKLDDDEKLTRKFFVSGQNRNMVCVTESGLYTLVLRSNKPEAKPFKRWITHEVLPSIRKTGSYSTPSAAPAFDPAPFFYAMQEQNAMMIQTMNHISCSMENISAMTRTVMAEQRDMAKEMKTYREDMNHYRFDMRRISFLHLTGQLSPAQESPKSPTITEEQTKKLHSLITSNAKSISERTGIDTGIIAAGIFSRLKERYSIPSYTHLTQDLYGEAVTWASSIKTKI